MSMNVKSVGLDSATPYRVGAYEDDRARLKYQALMLDYQELQKEVVIKASRLEAGKQRKAILAAEVRFLQKRFKYLVKAKTLNSSQKEKLVQPPNLHKQTKQTKELVRNEAAFRMLPPLPDVRPKKRQCISKEVASRGTSLNIGKESIQCSLTMITDFSHKGRADTRKNNMMRSRVPFFDLNKKGRMYANDTAPSNTSAAFDLNRGESSSGMESTLPSRAPIFDLNEISTGDEDLETNAEAAKHEEARRSLMRHMPTDEVQNDLMLSVCRNAGEGPSRVGKRKISWQDPVALSV